MPVTTTANGARVAFEQTGQGEPVVFLHAFPFNSQMWQPQIEALSDDYNVIRVDLPGFGGSQGMESPSMIAMADAVLAVLDAAQVRLPAVFVGLSMGGYVLFELFRQAPERIRALVLADTRAQADSDEVRARRYRTIDQVEAQGASVVADGLLSQMLTEGASDELRAQVRAMMEAAPPDGIVGALRAMAVRPDSTPDLEDISRPVLVIVGEQDPISPPAEARAMAEAIAGAQLEVIPNASHLSNVEQPEAFTAALLRFLDNLEPVDRQGWPKRPDAGGATV